MKLYSYWRSSSAYRVRIALNLKGLAYETLPVDLVKDGGQQHAPAYATVNPQQLVPALVRDDGSVLTQSLAIIDWLDATHPDPRLIPLDPEHRARVLEASHVIAMETQPLSNSGTGTLLKSRFGASPDDVIAWMSQYMKRAFDVLEPMIAPAPFGFGATPGLFDICLVPQLYNARRWGLDLAPYSSIRAVEAACAGLPAFDAARPENQPDAH